MIVIVCIDDGGGMMFNHRRQSQDRILRGRIAEETKDSRLLMDPYTARQFRDNLPQNAVVSEDFLEEAHEGDYCFVEDKDISPYEDKIEKIIVYRWNRDYPRDAVFPVDLSGWQLESTEDFEGSSHDEITREVYVR